MDEDAVREYADIRQDGSVLLGNHTVCDGADHGRSICVFTHIHRDHVRLFDPSLVESAEIYVTRDTLDMLAAIKRVEDDCNEDEAKEYFEDRNIVALEYGRRVLTRLDPFSTEPGTGDAITLHESGHVLGSCQVVVDAEDGTRIAYTGDFGGGARPPAGCDILVMDSTHGHDRFGARADVGHLEGELVRYVRREIEESKNVVIRAPGGRLQYTMHLLHKSLGNDVSFLTDPKNEALATVYRDRGMDIRRCVIQNSDDGAAIRDGGGACVEFKSPRSGAGTSEGDADKTAVFRLGGSYLGGGTTIRKNGGYRLEFMDHANYPDIIRYVKEANPKYVVTDYVRGRQGANLAEAIQRELGIRAIPLPMDEPTDMVDG